MRAVVVILAAFPALAVAVGAQEDGPPARFVNEVEVTVVNLEVFVRDHDGNPVTGLGPDDFRIFQDGVEMPISNFFAAEGDRAIVASRSEPEPGAAAITRSPPVRPSWMVVHMDNENLRPAARKRVLRQLREFVDTAMTGELRVAVVSSRQTLELRQEFTDNPMLVHAALDRVARESSGRLARDRQRERIIERMERYASAKASSSYELDRGPDDVVTQAQVEAQILAFSDEESAMVKDSLAALSDSVRLLIGLDGHRSVVYISSGLSMTPGIDLMYQYSDVFRDSTIFANLSGRERAGDYRTVATWANGHGVRLYTLDATGLMPPSGFGAGDRFVAQSRAQWSRERDLQSSLQYVAEATGGVAVFNTNNVSAGLARIRDDVKHAYSLGYTIARGDRDTTHRIEVELPGHPEVEVRHRRWIVSKSEATRVADRIAATLIRGGTDNPLELRLIPGVPRPGEGSTWTVPVQLSVPLRHLTLVPGEDGLVGRVEIYLGIRDDRGREARPRGISYEIRVPAADQAAIDGVRYGINLELQCRGREQTVAAGLRDRLSGRISFARTELELD